MNGTKPTFHKYRSTPYSTENTIDVNDRCVIYTYFKYIENIEVGKKFDAKFFVYLYNFFKIITDKNILDKKKKDLNSELNEILDKSNNESKKFDFTVFYVENYIKPYITLNIDNNYDFNNKAHRKRQVKLLIEILKSVLYTTKKNNALCLYELLSLMEQNAITGVLDINKDEKLNNLFISKCKDFIDMSKPIFNEHLEETGNTISIIKISNTFITNIILLLYPDEERSGGGRRRTKKIYTGSRGAKYTISIKNGKKIKKYIK